MWEDITSAAASLRELRNRAEVLKELASPSMVCTCNTLRRVTRKRL